MLSTNNTLFAIDIERIIIGTLLSDSNIIEEVVDILSPLFFYKKEHTNIYILLLELFNNNRSTDIFSVINELNKRNELSSIGGEEYLLFLIQQVISTNCIKQYIEIIKEKFILRNIVNIGYKLIDKNYYTKVNPFVILNETEDEIFKLQQMSFKKDFIDSNIIFKNTIDILKKLNINNKNNINGIPSGFIELDKITYGWQNGDLIILAARPGVGKTSFMLSMIKYICIDNRISTGIFSLEMSGIQLINKLITYITNLSIPVLKKIYSYKEKWIKFCKIVNKYKNSPLFIDDSSSISILELKAKLKRLINKNKIKMLFIDYLQLITVTDNNYKLSNREQEISVISRNLKSIAKELNIPIFVLSQLSRAVEVRGGDKRPILSDLRESGSIEQDADIVIFIYRPQYYGLKVWDYNNSSSCLEQAEIIISKHRNGPLGNIKLKFVSRIAKFENLN